MGHSHGARVVRRLAHHLILTGALLNTACASTPDIATPFSSEEMISAKDKSVPLGGDALVQRKREMRRTYRDMLHFRATIESLERKRRRNGWIQLSNFLNAYMERHLGPMLRPSWQSEHPELMALDANLRLIETEVLIQLRDTRRAQQALREIQRRYEGRETMLVEYPVGRRGSLSSALELLSKRKWRG